MKFRTIVPTLILIMVVAAFAAPANAQITITGPSNGFCTSQPALTAGVPGIRSFSYVLYGAGQNNDPNCGGAPSTQNGSIDEAAFTSLNPGVGFDMVGAGTLKGFLIRVGNGTGGGFQGHVWIQHADGTTSNGPVITCSTPTNTSGQPADCTDTTTSVPVLDKDKVVIFMTGNPGDTYKDIRWYLGKQ